MAANTNIEKILTDLTAALRQPQQAPSTGQPDQFKGLADLQKRQMGYQVYLASDKKGLMYVEIPMLYQKHIGQYLEVGLNGSTIKIPVDGRRHAIHKDFYPLIKKKLRHVDEKESRNNSYDSTTGQSGDIFEYQPR